jgi:hypothetical protein
MTSSSRRDATRSPWVARALRHEAMVQPRGTIMASRKYTGVTRNAEADEPLTLADVSRLPDEVQWAMARSMLDAAEGRVCRDHWLASHIGWCGVDDPTLDPAYPGVTPVCDICDEPDGPGEPDWNGETGCHASCEQDDGSYYSDGSRV